jgi:hypothetical protein
MLMSMLMLRSKWVLHCEVGLYRVHRIDRLVCGRIHVESVNLGN